MIAGIDEAGKGCVLGSLFLAIAGIKDISKLQNLGLADSKKLKPKVREALYQKLIKLLDFYKIVEIFPQEIDSGNLLDLESKYTKQLIQQYLPEEVYVDCPHPRPEKYQVRIATDNVKIITEHKADDKYLICSAASILAKVERDRALKKLGITMSGYPGDRKTIDHLKSLYPDFPSYVRLSWETTKRIIRENEEVEQDLF